jgi:hypothetical protein
MTLGTSLALLGAVVLVAGRAAGLVGRAARPRQAARPGQVRPAGSASNPAATRRGPPEPATGAEPAPMRCAPRAARPAGRADRRHGAADAGAPVSGEFLLSHLPPSAARAPRFPDRGPGRRDRPVGAADAGRAMVNCRPACSWPAAAGAQRDRVLRIRAEGAGLRRRRGRHARLPGHAGRGGPRARARRLRRPLDAVLTVTLRSQRRGLVGGLRAAVRGAPGLRARRVPGRLVLPAAEDGAPPVLVLSFDPQAALADDPQAAAVRECTLSGRAADRRGAEPFPAWHNAARTLADDMDATDVDDQASRSRCTPSPPSAPN